MQTHTPLTISPQHLIPGLLLTGLLFLAYLVLHECLLTAFGLIGLFLEPHSVGCTIGGLASVVGTASYGYISG